MKKIKLFDPYVNDIEKRALNRVFNSHFWASGSGTGNVQKFEKEFSKYVGSRSSVAVNSGTAALNLALSMYNIKNKEVLFHLVTLPVELDASFRRALPILIHGNYIPESSIPIARKILTAAALTYLAASLASVLNFYRWLTFLRR